MKELFQWSAAFETGFAHVDSQHRALIDMINAAMPFVVSHEDVTIRNIGGMLDELVEYATLHFDDEERLMAEHGLAAGFVAEHLRQHHEFAAEVARQREQARHDKVDAVRLLHYLIRWLTNHIVGTDRCMAQQIRDIEAGMTPDAAWERARAPSHRT